MREYPRPQASRCPQLIRAVNPPQSSACSGMIRNLYLHGKQGPMSFDLTVWRASKQVTAAEAKRLNAEWCGRPLSELKPSAEMTGFVRDVAVDFHAGDGAENDEPWAVEPDIGDGYVLIAIPSSAILRRGAEEYIQVGLGPQAGVRSGHYAIEYRAGSPEQHFRTLVSNVEEVVGTFAQYLDRDEAFSARHSWRRVHF